jgi:hypothetical protein
MIDETSDVTIASGTFDDRCLKHNRSDLMKIVQ